MRSWFKNKEIIPKVVAVVLAAFVWLQVINEQNPFTKQVTEVPVKVVNLAEGWRVLSVSPERLRVTLGGRVKTFQRSDLGKIEALVDLSSVELSPGPFETKPVITPPSGLRVLEMSPAVVQVDVDPVVSTQVPVRVQVTGKPHEDYQQGALLYTVTEVTVSGPKRLVERVEVASAQLDVTGAQSEVVRRIKLVPRDSTGEEVPGLSVTPGEVEARVPMIPLPPSKSLPVQVTQDGSPAPGYRVKSITVRPSLVKVRLSWAGSSPSVIPTKPVKLTGQSSSFTTVVELALPPGVIPVQDTSVTVFVEIVEDIVTKTFSNIPVTVKNKSPGLGFDLVPAEVNVVIEGRRDLVDKVTRPDISAYVDAQGLPEGEYNVVVRAEIEGAEGVSVKTIEPSSVTLHLKRW
ncbi:MAG TPA: hypothetical protein GX510_01690 [Firmicutes bacterium]|nr:hypothetical protein [Candidatus Fermentithermobacillaceae bacterium]